MRSVLPARRAVWRCAVNALSALCWMVLAGCESDPVLSPQPEEEEEGSYGRSVLTTGEAAGDRGAREPNPAVF